MTLAAQLSARRPFRSGALLTVHDTRLLIASVAVQLALAALLGHAYDTRVFMATGYLVGTGQNPYLSQDLSAVFRHVSFDAAGTIGYPPPWPLLLGLLYLGSFSWTHNLIVYNLVIKLPVIAANIGLAYLVAAMLGTMGATMLVRRRAWLFLLFNPLLLYFGAAWGQIDSIAALLALAALALLYSKRQDVSAVLLALSVCFKPIALPVVVVALVYLAGRSGWRALRFAGIFLAAAFVFYVLPFLVLGWDAGEVLRNANSHFVLQGTMSLVTVARATAGSLDLPGHWWLLGLAWIPALVIGAFVIRKGVDDLEDLVRKSTALVLIFFLARTWLAEPNVVLVVSLALILVSLEALDRRLFTALWVIPLLFTVFNGSPLRLLFVGFPGTMERAVSFFGHLGTIGQIGRALLVLAWQVTGWWVVVTCLRRRSAVALEHEPGGVGVLATWR